MGEGEVLVQAGQDTRIPQPTEPQIATVLYKWIDLLTANLCWAIGGLQARVVWVKQIPCYYNIALWQKKGK